MPPASACVCMAHCFQWTLIAMPLLPSRSSTSTPHNAPAVPCCGPLPPLPGAASGLHPSRAQVVGLQRQWVMSRSLAAARVALIKWLLEAGSRQGPDPSPATVRFLVGGRLTEPMRSAVQGLQACAAAAAALAALRRCVWLVRGTMVVCMQAAGAVALPSAPCAVCLCYCRCAPRCSSAWGLLWRRTLG